MCSDEEEQLARLRGGNGSVGAELGESTWQCGGSERTCWVSGARD